MRQLVDNKSYLDGGSAQGRLGIAQEYSRLTSAVTHPKCDQGRFLFDLSYNLWHSQGLHHLAQGGIVNKIKPQLPSGMRDYLPADVLRRQYVMDTIAEVFETYGYEPLQTPVLEMQQTLMGKYGEDAEKLIYQ